ncbi:MAG TPA: O-antigen ligase family protein, partial [bacterium]|nr:O-antigen ligase family protein [bacterium]
FVMLLRSSGRTAWLGWRLAGLVILFALVLTRVRGAEIAAAVGFLFLVAAFALPWGRDLFQRNRRQLWGLLGVLVVAGALTLFWKGDAGWAGAGASLAQREAIYRTAWEIVKDHPWTGVGLGQVGAVYPAYQYRPYAPQDYADHPYVYTEHVHDEYLQFWVEGGLAGLLLFLAVLAAFALAVRKALKSPATTAEGRELLLGVCAGMTALLTQALSNFPFQVAPTAVLFGLFLAAPLALRPPIPVPPGRLDPAKTWALGLALLLGAAGGIRILAGTIAARDTAGENSLGHAQKAVYYAGRLTTLLPWSPKAWNLAGQALGQAGQGDAAAKAYERSLALNPGYVENFMALADLRARAGDLP